MAKFFSNFKETEGNLGDSDSKEPGLTPDIEKEKDIENNKPSSPEEPEEPSTRMAKVKQFLRKAQSLGSAIAAKLPDSDKPIYRRPWVWVSVGVSGSVIALTYGWAQLGQGLPDTRDLFTVVRQDTLTIKAGDGTILRQQGPATREQLNLDQIPKPLVQAFLAAEDRRFYQHNGVDYQGILRAVFANLRSRDVVEGGSTITQQLSRILFLNQERSVLRKLREMRLSQKIEEKLTKNQILERYLNLVYLGSGAYGVGDAAWVYFSKTVDELSLPEMATIAALAPAPSSFSPAVNPDVAKRRRNIVLQRMQEDGFITKAQLDRATAEPVTVKTSLPKRLQITAPYFTIYVQKELPKYVSQEAIEAGGLTVETSLNPAWQKAAEETVDKAITENGRSQRFKQAALVAIDPRSGEIKAMVGGRDFGKNQFNRVTQAQRQPGSTFKGFVYAAAVAAGKKPTDGYRDSPFIVDGYEPKNYSESFRGWVNMRDALTQSLNIVALRVLIDVGFEPTIKLAKAMGIKSELQPTYSLALGSWEVNLLELTSAYGTFATNGMHVEPHGIRRILNRRGDVIWSADFKSERALDEGSSAIMNWMLRKVVDDGTGRPAQLDDNRPVAGKTGTSDEYRDLWFIGYIPQLVTGVWLGNDDNQPTRSRSGTAAYTWNQFMEQAVEEMPVEKFPDRPSLAGWKGTIKAEPVKPKRMINKEIPDDNDESSSDSDSSTRRRWRSDDDDNDRSVSRRSRRSRSSDDDNESSSRRSRRSWKSDDDDSTPRRTRRRRSSDDSDSSSRRSRRSWKSDDDDSTPRRTRRRRSSDDSDSSSRRSRRSWKSDDNDSTPRRTRRRRSRSEQTNSSNSSSESSRPRLRRRRSSSDDSSSGSSRRSRERSSSSSSEGRSWRERLRPSSSDSESQ